jgi:hypothetical protein
MKLNFIILSSYVCMFFKINIRIKEMNKNLTEFIAATFHNWKDMLRGVFSVRPSTVFIINTVTIRYRH